MAELELTPEIIQEAFIAASGRSVVRRAVGIGRSIAGWDEALHPRGKDGRFIEKNGFVAGRFTKDDGTSVDTRSGKILGFKSDSNDPSDPFVLVELPDGSRAVARASRVSSAGAAKARLDKLDFNMPDTPENVPDLDFIDSLDPSSPLPDEDVKRLSPPQATAYVNLRTRGASTVDARERAMALDPVLAQMFNGPLDTDVINDRLGPAKNEWTAERNELHERMWNDFLGRVRAKNIPRDRDALVLGGLPGAGKSTALEPGGPAEQWGVRSYNPLRATDDDFTHVNINPDDLKEMLIDYGALPPGLEFLKPMEQVSFLHSESGWLANMFMERLTDDGYNVTLDVTMSDERSMINRLIPLTSNGYKVRGLFADVSVEESKISTRRRYEALFDTERGGRLVPSSVQSDRHSTRSQSKNRDVFDTLVERGWFQEYMAIDNVGVSRGQPAGIVTLDSQAPADAVPNAAVDAAFKMTGVDRPHQLGVLDYYPELMTAGSKLWSNATLKRGGLDAIRSNLKMNVYGGREEAYEDAIALVEGLPLAPITTEPMYRGVIRDKYSSDANLEVGQRLVWPFTTASFNERIAKDYATDFGDKRHQEGQTIYVIEPGANHIDMGSSTTYKEAVIGGEFEVLNISTEYENDSEQTIIRVRQVGDSIPPTSLPESLPVVASSDSAVPMKPDISLVDPLVINEAQLAQKIRRKELTPEDGLKLLKYNMVRVTDEARLADARTWEDVESEASNASSLMHTLSILETPEEMMTEYGNEIVRLRQEGVTMSNLSK